MPWYMESRRLAPTSIYFSWGDGLLLMGPCPLCRMVSSWETFQPDVDQRGSHCPGLCPFPLNRMIFFRVRAYFSRENDKRMSRHLFQLIHPQSRRTYC